MSSKLDRAIGVLAPPAGGIDPAGGYFVLATSSSSWLASPWAIDCSSEVSAVCSELCRANKIAEAAMTVRLVANSASTIVKPPRVKPLRGGHGRSAAPAEARRWCGQWTDTMGQ